MAIRPTTLPPAATQTKKPDFRTQTAATPFPAYRGRALALFRQIPWVRWWNQFCTAKTRDGCMRYRTSWEFCVKKGRDWQETNLLFAMIGPDPEWANFLWSFAAPRLGDWELRRQFRRMFGDWSKDLKALGAIHDGTLSLDVLRMGKRKLARLIGLDRRLEQQIDIAFAGQPFLPNIAADSIRNRTRARAYMRLKGRLGRELCCCAEFLVSLHVVDAYLDFSPTAELINRAGMRAGQSSRAHSLKALQTLQTDIARLVQGKPRIAEKVDEAFAGQLFLYDQEPTSPRNRQRALLYLRFLRHAQEQLLAYLHLWVHIVWVSVYLEPVPIGHKEADQREDK